MKLEFFIRCSIKFLFIYLQFICNINQQRVDNKIKIFYSRKSTYCVVILNKSTEPLGLWMMASLPCITTVGSSTIFSIKSSSNFWQVISSIFNLQYNNLLQVLIFFNHFKHFFRNRLLLLNPQTLSFTWHMNLALTILVLWLTSRVLNILLFIWIYRFIINLVHHNIICIMKP